MISMLDTGLNVLGSSLGQGTALCSWARHFTLIVPLLTQVYKWKPPSLVPPGGGSRNTPKESMISSAVQPERIH